MHAHDVALRKFWNWIIFKKPPHIPHHRKHSRTTRGIKDANNFSTLSVRRWRPSYTYFAHSLIMLNWHVHNDNCLSAISLGWTWTFGVSNTKNKYQRTLVQRLWVFDTHAERGSDPGWCRSDTYFMHVTGERRENTICIRSQAMKFYNGSSLSSITLSQKPQWDNKDGTLELTSRNCSAIHSRGSCVAW